MGVSATDGLQCAATICEKSGRYCSDGSLRIHPNGSTLRRTAFDGVVRRKNQAVRGCLSLKSTEVALGNQVGVVHKQDDLLRGLDWKGGRESVSTAQSENHPSAERKGVGSLECAN